ncbi:unnamed protein product [Fusarium langsethiae]|nr:unnamed protein product [Fusarium langsethiae]
MPSFKNNSLLLLSFLSLTAVATPSIPTTERSIEDIDTVVYIRSQDSGFYESQKMTKAVKVKQAALPLHKRSSAKVEACYSPQCTECRVIYDGTLSSNSPCVQALNTSCLIVSNLNNAKVQAWNKAKCNGNQSTFRGCGARTNHAAPGTNSIGVHIGCN